MPVMRKRTNNGKLVCAGEFFFDLIFYGLVRLPQLGEESVTDNFAFSLGGGAVITATVASRLGSATELATVLGGSALDRFALEELDRRGIARKLVRQSDKYPTGGITVGVSTKRDRYFLTANGANQAVARHLLTRPVRSAMARARHVHFGLSPREWRLFPALLADLRRAGVTTSWDLGWHPDALRDPQFRRTIALTDILFMNELEALRFARANSLDDALLDLRSPEQLLVVKLGKRGSLAVDDGHSRVHSSAVKVNAVDTTGAGDAFNGGFLHLWLRGASVRDCLRAGNICGALTTRAPGGTAAAPTTTEFQRLMRRSD